MKKFILISLLTITSSAFASNLFDPEPVGNDGRSSDTLQVSRPVSSSDLVTLNYCFPKNAQYVGLGEIFEIGKNQDTAKQELERLAVVSSSLRQSDAAGSEALVKIMTLVRAAYDSKDKTDSGKNAFITRFSSIDDQSIGCGKIQKLNDAVSFYMKNYRK